VRCTEEFGIWNPVDEGDEAQGGDRKYPAHLDRHAAIGVTHFWRIVTALITITPAAIWDELQLHAGGEGT
jgi:hypothetical protein